MAKKYTRISCFPETKKKIMEDCKQQFLKSHPEFQAMPEEPFDRENLAAHRVKNLIGEIYD